MIALGSIILPVRGYSQINNRAIQIHIKGVNTLTSRNTGEKTIFFNFILHPLCLRPYQNLLSLETMSWLSSSPFISGDYYGFKTWARSLWIGRLVLMYLTYQFNILVPSRPICDLHMLYLLRPIFSQTCRYFSGLYFSNIPRYFLDLGYFSFNFMTSPFRLFVALKSVWTVIYKF